MWGLRFRVWGSGFRVRRVSDKDVGRDLPWSSPLLSVIPLTHWKRTHMKHEP